MMGEVFNFNKQYGHQIMTTQYTAIGHGEQGESQEQGSGAEYSPSTASNVPVVHEFCLQKWLTTLEPGLFQTRPTHTETNMLNILVALEM
jgi:hypothetical protein